MVNGSTTLVRFLNHLFLKNILFLWKEKIIRTQVAPRMIYLSSSLPKSFVSEAKYESCEKKVLISLDKK